MSTITIDEMEAYCKKLGELRDQAEVIKKTLSAKNEEIDEVENKLLSYLKETGKTSYKSNYGTVIRSEKWRVNLPATAEDRERFFAYLKEKGVFDGLITVHSNTLNSYYMQEWEVAKNSGDADAAMHFGIPGIGEPKLHETIGYRRG